MIHYLERRTIALIPAAIGVATLTFAMIHLVPGDPVTAMLGDHAAPAEILQMRHVLLLRQSVIPGSAPTICAKSLSESHRPASPRNA